MQYWTEQGAVEVLGEIAQIQEKQIRLKTYLRHIQEAAAIDFLQKYCGYHSVCVFWNK
ncbi:MAG: hypothetical protein ACOX60_06780 [Massiliimalia sp.]|jgi:hypothetical protein